MAKDRRKKQFSYFNSFEMWLEREREREGERATKMKIVKRATRNKFQMKKVQFKHLGNGPFSLASIELGVFGSFLLGCRFREYLKRRLYRDENIVRIHLYAMCFSNKSIIGAHTLNAICYGNIRRYMNHSKYEWQMKETAIAATVTFTITKHVEFCVHLSVISYIKSTQQYHQ